MNAQAATLRQAVVPRSDLLTDALLVLAGTGFVAGAAQISVSLGFTPVPITGQTFAVVLVGASLGAVRGTASLMLYLWLGVAGAPIYAYGLYPFVPGDVFKLYLAAALLPGAWKLVERTSNR